MYKGSLFLNDDGESDKLSLKTKESWGFHPIFLNS